MSKKAKKTKSFFNSPGVRLVLAIAIPIIVILIVIMIIVLLKPEEVREPRLVLDNFAEMLPEVPEDTERRIEEKLYTQVMESGVSEVPESGAMIRDGSVNRFTIRDEFYVGDFIVDIAEVEQSYIMEYYYGQLDDKKEIEASTSVMVYCVEDPDEVIYEDFVCRAGRDYVRPDPIQYVLPQEFSNYSLSYTYSLTSESGYAVVVTYDPPESVYLSGKLEAFENEKMGEIREYLMEAGMDPDDYEFIVKYKIVE